MEKFVAIEDGVEKEYSIIMTFDSDKTNKSYIVYTDGSKDSLGNLEERVSSFNIIEDKYLLSPIENEKEWNMVKIVINTIQNN